MRYSSTAAIVTALVASVAAAPSFEQYSQQQQLTFLDPVAQQASAFLKESKALVESFTESVGNVADKGARWLQEHINDPRCEFARLLIDRMDLCVSMSVRPVHAHR